MLTFHNIKRPQTCLVNQKTPINEFNMHSIINFFFGIAHVQEYTKIKNNRIMKNNIHYIMLGYDPNPCNTSKTL